jgi:hypothetical protein
MPLADKRAVDTLIGKPLTNGVHCIPERHAVAQDAVAMRVESGPYR